MSELGDEMMATFRDEAASRLDAMDSALMAVEAGTADAGVVDGIFRDAHTIKGAAGMLGLDDIASVANAIEDLLSEVRAEGEFPSSLAGVLLEATGTLRRMAEGEELPVGGLLRELSSWSDSDQADGGAEGDREPAGGTRPEDPAGPGAVEDPAGEGPEKDPAPEKGSAGVGQPAGPGAHQEPARRRPMVRVPAEKIDALAGMVGEVIQDRRRMAHALRHGTGKGFDAAGMLDSGERVLNELRDTAVGIRTLPISVISGSMSRAVRDLARGAGKDVELVVTGGETELDRAILESLTEPLTHLFRNAVDHGIEPPDDRVSAGKPPRGTIEVRATPRGGLVEVEVSDDGRGVPATVAEEARTAGSLVDVMARPGFSTSDEVTDLAGRGVGLDAVRAYVRSQGGSLDIRSVPGHGTTITLLLPLTLAQLTVLVFERGGSIFGVPLSVVEEVLPVQSTRTLGGRATVELHGRSLPLIDIANLLDADVPDFPPYPPAVAVRSGERSVAVVCDVLVGQEEVTVRPLGPLVAGGESYLGAAILADGRIVLIIDPAVLGRPSGAVTIESRPAGHRTGLKVLVVEDSATVIELHRRILETAGYLVVTAADGREALDLIRRDNEIALVITDLEMPEMDGLELVRAIRADWERRALPVIIVTARTSPEGRRTGFEAGADAYMTKQDFSQRALLGTIERLASKSLTGDG